MTTEIARTYPRRGNSLVQCLKILEYEPAFQSPTKRGFSFHKSSVFKEIPLETLEEISEQLYYSAMKKYHPDLHTLDKEYYTERTKSITEAYDRIKHLLELRHNREYDDVMNYATVRF